MGRGERKIDGKVRVDENKCTVLYTQHTILHTDTAGRDDALTKVRVRNVSEQRCQENAVSTSTNIQGSF